MKKLIAIFLVLLALPTMAADLELRVAAGSNGYLTDHSIDASAIAADGVITLELVLSNLDFTLAGFETAFEFPTYIAWIDVDAIGTPTGPYSSSLAAVQKLPADSMGADTAITFRNDSGRARIGGVITDPAQRPTTGDGDQILATFRLTLGRDHFGSASCISATELIRMIGCTNGSATCEIFADENAAQVAVNYVDADLEISLTNTSTTALKGDYNGDGFMTTQDVTPAILCNVFGFNDVTCPLMGVAEPELSIRADVNCDGGFATTDIGPLIRRALGLYGRPSSNKRLNYMELADNDGVLNFPGEDSAGTVATVDLKVQGKVRFAEKIELSSEAISNGWQVFTRELPRTNSFRYMLVNMTGENNVIPSVNVRYEVLEQGSRVAISNVESYAADSKPVRHMPELSREDLRENR